MKPRERAIKAINHEEPDRVPLEGIYWGEWAYPFLLKLFDHLGVKDEDAVAKKLDIDFRAVSVEPPDSFKEKAVCDRYFHYPWGIRVASDTIEDEWGVRRQLNATRTQSRVVYHPLRGKESLDGYEFPDPLAEGRFETAERLVKKWRDTYAVAGGCGIDSFFCQGWYMRGFRELVLDVREAEVRRGAIRSAPRVIQALIERTSCQSGDVGNFKLCRRIMQISARRIYTF